MPQSVINLILALAMIDAAVQPLRAMQHKLNNAEHAKNLAMHMLKKYKEKHPE